jgi:hypothetical protein
VSLASGVTSTAAQVGPLISVVERSSGRQALRRPGSERKPMSVVFGHCLSVASRLPSRLPIEAVAWDWQGFDGWMGNAPLAQKQGGPTV